MLIPGFRVSPNSISEANLFIQFTDPYISETYIITMVLQPNACGAMCFVVWLAYVHCIAEHFHVVLHQNAIHIKFVDIKAWSGHNVAWAATSAVAAAILAPFATQVAPLLVYVNAETYPQLVSVADLADLSPIRGGRLTLRPFPTKATAKLCTWQDGLNIVPWARCYADLVTTGVRGEDIATNLREMKLSERSGAGTQS
jgi:hypothetical protein